jgi:GntR family transcriptional regulator
MKFYDLITFDKRQNTPLKVQLMNQLRLAIYDYHLSEKFVLPSIQDLSKTFMMQEKDVEIALQTLQQEGLITSSKKNEYIVSHKRHSNEFMAKGFLLFQYIKKLGLEPAIVTLEQTMILADETIAKKMNIQVGERLLYLKRIYSGNQKPLVFLESFLNINLMPAIEKMMFTNQPHLEVILKHYAFEPYRSVRENRVIALNREQAKALQDMENAPCHQVEVWTYDKTGKLMDYNLATLTSADVFETITEPHLIQSTF